MDTPNFKQLLLQSMFKNALILGVFATLSTAIIATTYQITKERILRNEQNAKIRILHELIPEDAYDNNLIESTITLPAHELLGTKDATTAYVASKAGEPKALLFPIIAPDGYSGSIKLIIGIYTNQTIAGVRTLVHAETPGLGDKVDIEKSDWILSFAGKSLDNPAKSKWRVKKDGGDFDQFTGATITPRAVVNAVFNAQEYFVKHQNTLFADYSTGDKP